MTNWDPTQSQILLQKGGPGNPLQILDTAETALNALSGGGRSYESDWSGQQYEDYAGTRITGNPERVTGSLLARLQTRKISILQNLARKGCLFNVIAMEGCAVKDRIEVTDFNSAFVLVDSGVTNSPGVTDNGLVQRVDPANTKVMQSADLSAALIEIWLPLAPIILSGGAVGTQTADITSVIFVGDPRCAGVCGPEREGDEELVYGTEAVGLGPEPLLVYNDAGGSPTADVSNAMTGIGDADITGLARVGNHIVISATGTDGGLYYAHLDDVKAGNAVGVASNITTNANAVASVNGSYALAVGATGLIWRTTNGGGTWTVIAAANVLTTETLTDVIAAGPELAWAVGTNGTLIRIRNVTGTPVAEVVPVTGLTDDITSVRVPHLRTREVYFGTDGGEVYRSRDAGVNFELVPVPTVATSSIDGLSFGGIKGNTLFILQSDAGGDSRILVDRSGGAGGSNIAIIGGGIFGNPLVALASPNANVALGVGPVATTNAAITRVQGN